MTVLFAFAGPGFEPAAGATATAGALVVVVVVVVLVVVVGGGAFVVGSDNSFLGSRIKLGAETK